MDTRMKPIRRPGLRTKPIIVPNKFVYIPVAKAASSTFVLYFRRRGVRVRSPEQYEHLKRFAVIRHPVDRLMSAYHFAWYKKGRGIPLEQWWEHVRADPRIDMHVEPITDLFNMYNVKEDDYVLPLEHIREWWPKMVQKWPDVFNEDPDHSNARKSERAALPYDIRADMVQVYKHDLVLWEESVSRLGT